VQSVVVEIGAVREPAAQCKAKGDAVCVRFVAHRAFWLVSSASSAISTGSRIGSVTYGVGTGSLSS